MKDKIQVYLHTGEGVPPWTPINELWTRDPKDKNIPLNLQVEKVPEDCVALYSFSELPTDVQTFYALKVLSK